MVKSKLKVSDIANYKSFEAVYFTDYKIGVCNCISRQEIHTFLELCSSDQMGKYKIAFAWNIPFLIPHEYFIWVLTQKSYHVVPYILKDRLFVSVWVCEVISDKYFVTEFDESIKGSENWDSKLFLVSGTFLTTVVNLVLSGSSLHHYKKIEV